jgi:hypothetical protein
LNSWQLAQTRIGIHDANGDAGKLGKLCQRLNKQHRFAEALQVARRMPDLFDKATSLREISEALFLAKQPHSFEIIQEALRTLDSHTHKPYAADEITAKDISLFQITTALIHQRQFDLAKSVAHMIQFEAEKRKALSKIDKAVAEPAEEKKE